MSTKIIPLPSSSSADLASISRAERRKQRLIEMEREQLSEDAEALKMTEEQRQTLLLAFASVKVEFSDLDGMSWDNVSRDSLALGYGSIDPATGPINGRGSSSSTPSCPTLLPPPSLSLFVPQSIPEQEWELSTPISRDVDGDNLATSSQNDTIRVSSTRPFVSGGDIEDGALTISSTATSEHCSTATIRIMNKRDGTRTRSPIKNLFADPNPATSTLAPTCPQTSSPTEFLSAPSPPRSTLSKKRSADMLDYDVERDADNLDIDVDNERSLPGTSVSGSANHHSTLGRDGRDRQSKVTRGRHGRKAGVSGGAGGGGGSKARSRSRTTRMRRKSSTASFLPVSTSRDGQSPDQGTVGLSPRHVFTPPSSVIQAAGIPFPSSPTTDTHVDEESEDEHHSDDDTVTFGVPAMPTRQIVKEVSAAPPPPIFITKPVSAGDSSCPSEHRGF